MDNKKRIMRLVGTLLVVLILGVGTIAATNAFLNKDNTPSTEQSSKETNELIEKDIQWEAIVDEDNEYFFAQDAADPTMWVSNNKGVNSSTAVQAWKITIPEKLDFVEYILARDISSAKYEDFFTLELDGKEIVSEGCTEGKFKQILNLGPGEHILKASYHKDSSGYGGNDTATLWLEPLKASTVNEALKSYEIGIRWEIADEDLNYYFEKDGFKWVPNNVKVDDSWARTELTISIPQDTTYKFSYHVFNTSFALSSNHLVVELDGEEIVKAGNNRQDVPEKEIELTAGTHTLVLKYNAADCLASMSEDETYIILEPVFVGN